MHMDFIKDYKLLNKYNGVSQSFPLIRSSDDAHIVLSSVNIFPCPHLAFERVKTVHQSYAVCGNNGCHYCTFPNCIFLLALRRFNGKYSELLKCKLSV